MRGEIATLEAMTDAERRDYGWNRKDEHLRYLLEEKRVRDGELGQCRQMLTQAQAWQPPTGEHQGLKDFMVQQISESMGLLDGYYEAQIEAAKTRTPTSFYEEALAEAKRHLAWSEEQWQKEVERTEERNRWLSDLRASLAG